MNRPEPIGNDDAIFLDFDGTLVDLAEHPEQVQPDARLPELLGALSERLDGAVALVTGRPLVELDRKLAPYRAVAAGLHGLEWRDAPGAPTVRSSDAAPTELAAAAGHIRRNLPPGAWLEDKHAALAIHFRAAPHAIGSCRALAHEVADRIGFEVLAGKMVFEIRPRGFDKGEAVERIMALDAFCARRPVFIGDDVTDEDAFAVAQARGGIGVKVGPGATTALCRLADVASVHAWLSAAARG